MSKSWYILQVFTGHEKKVEKMINLKLENGEIDKNILTQVKVPEEEISEVKDGKKKVRKSLILPGYVMLEMDLPTLNWKDTCSKIRRQQGVNGFVGTEPNVRPRPISNEEAKNILQRSGDVKGSKITAVKHNFEIGENVKINEGPFATFSGVIEEINAEKNKLRVVVQIFGRATPVEVDMLQVAKI